MTRVNRRRSTALVFGVLFSAAAGVRADDAKDIDRTPKPCIMVNSIERDEAASDRTVLFFMRGKDKQIFRNDLPNSCAFLKRGETELEYHYNTQSVKLTRLCNYDGITVQHANQITCAIGKFTPVTADEAATLLGHPVGAGDAAAAPAKGAGATSSSSNSASQQGKKK
jgi:hypothetical protein